MSTTMTNEAYQEISPEAREKAKAILKHRFRYTNREHPFVAQLIRFAFEQLLEKLAVNITAQKDKEIAPPPLQSALPVIENTLSLDDFLEQKIDLLSLPQIVGQLQEVLNAPKASADDIAKIISNDIQLTASLLRLVNSPMYAPMHTIETVPRAVAVIGIRQLSSLAMGTTLINDMSTRLQEEGLEQFWQHSIACAVIAKRFAEQASLSEPERYFVDGLLHDIGRLFLLGAYPEESQKIRRVAAERGTTLHSVEVEVFGFGHAEVGHRILEKWKLSPATTDAVGFHHTPEKLSEAPHDDHHIIHLADAMAKALGYHAKGDFFVPYIADVSWRKLGFSPAQLQQALADLHKEIDSISQILLT